VGLGFDGLIYGNPRQLGVQTLAVVVVAAYAGLGTFIICFIIDKLFGLKISPEKEEQGTRWETNERLNDINGPIIEPVVRHRTGHFGAQGVCLPQPHADGPRALRRSRGGRLR
jgi:hypothetical protein